MIDAEKLAESLHYDGTREYTRVDGDVAYLDGKRLGRPAEMPRPQRNVLKVIVAIAVIIGAIILFRTVISPLQASLTAGETVAANIERPASLPTVPPMGELITMDDASIKALIEEEGYSFYDATSLTDSGNMMLLKLPDDVSVEEAGALYLRGIGSLSAADATRLLCGSWMLSVDRINTTSMVVRYADFTTGDPQTAIQNALAHEGFDSATVTDSGVDDSQNTYTAGIIGSEEGDEVRYTWRVSALPLDEMYSIRDLPEDACYVGIRVTKA